MKLTDIATALSARVENAAPDTEISGVSGIDQAVPGQLTFVHNPKYAAAAKTTRASAVIVDEKFPAISTGMLRTNNPVEMAGNFSSTMTAEARVVFAAAATWDCGRT